MQLTKGQVVVIACATRQIDSRCEAVLSLVDPNGKLLVRGRSFPEQDTHLAFQAPADGRYVIRIHDAVYGSGSEYFYRLEVGSQPYITAVFPPSGPAGELLSFTLFGYNLLPASADPLGHLHPLQQADHLVLLPKTFAPLAVGRDHFVAPRSSVLAACPVKLEGSAAVPVFQASDPVLAEREPNDEPSAAHALPIPSECAGQFYPARDRDWFEFTAAKGQRLSIEVISNRLGLATDPSLLVQRIERTEQGEERIAETQRLDDPADRERTIGDFDLLSDDPAYSFTAGSDSLYRVMVRNNLGASLDDPTAMYRLCVRPRRPDFELVAIPLAIKTENRNQVPQWSPVLRRGGTTMIKVHVLRRDGFDGTVQVSAENLPPGVTCPSAFLSGSESEVPLIFAAATDAPAAATAIRIVGRSTIEGEEVVREAAAATLVWSSPNKQQQLPSFRAASDVVLSVADAETVPISILSPAEPHIWEAKVGDVLSIPFRIERRGDFKDSIKLTPAGIPKDFQAKEVEAAGDSEEFLVTLAAARAGAFSCYVEGEAKVRYQRNPAAVAEAEQEHALLKTVVDELKQSIGSAAEDDREPDEQQLRSARLERAEKALQAAEARVAEAEKNNQPKDITVPILSTPIQIKVHPK